MGRGGHGQYFQFPPMKVVGDGMMKYLLNGLEALWYTV